MKARKFILPLVAVLFALAGALASPTLAQIGWYDSNGPSPGGGVQGNITTPPGNTPVCTSLGSQVCRIGIFEAYNSKAAAEAAQPSGMLRFTPVP